VPQPKILIVEDEPNLALLLNEWLQEEGYEVHTGANGREGIQRFYQIRPDLCIVDLIMPVMDGFQLVSRIREISDVHIIALTALGDERFVSRVLNLGADQYLVKPVTRKAFVARVKAVLRRITPAEGEPSTYSDRSLTLNYLTRELVVRGKTSRLRPTEFRLLGYLCQNSHRVVGQEETLNHVWGSAEGSLDSLKWYIHALREKVEEDPRSPRLILTVPGSGYRYRPDDGASDARSGSPPLAGSQ